MGDALVSKYLNEEAIALNHPDKTPAPPQEPQSSSRQCTASADEAKEPPLKGRHSLQDANKSRSDDKMIKNDDGGGSGNNQDGNNNSNNGSRPRGR